MSQGILLITMFFGKLGKREVQIPLNGFRSMYPIGLDQWIKIESIKKRGGLNPNFK
jgi:hypothetical protein